MVGLVMPRLSCPSWRPRTGDSGEESHVRPSRAVARIGRQQAFVNCARTSVSSLGSCSKGRWPGGRLPSAISVSRTRSNSRCASSGTAPSCGPVRTGPREAGNDQAEARLDDRVCRGSTMGQGLEASGQERPGRSRSPRSNSRASAGSSPVNPTTALTTARRVALLVTATF